MLILPIANKRRVMNVEIRLKNASKIRHGVCYDDANGGDIIVNREKFSDSSFKDSTDVKAPIDFIRSKSILYPRNFLVTTREESNSDVYDVYEVGQPPKKTTESIDKLYSMFITDMRKEIPNLPKRGKYISLKDLGFDKGLTDEKLALLQKIVREYGDSPEFMKKLEEAGIAELTSMADFINEFECTVISDSVIPEDSLQDSIKALSAINTRDYRNLNKYYNMAKSNKDIYTKFSYINEIAYDRHLKLHQSGVVGQKTLIKEKGDYDYKRAA